VKLSDVMAAAGLTSWAEVGLVISFLTFVAIVIYVFWRKRSRWEHVRHLPLEGDAPGDDAGMRQQGEDR